MDTTIYPSIRLAPGNIRTSRRWKVPAPQPLESLGLEIYQDINFAHRQEIDTHIKKIDWH
ncbi:MAG: hypothetical protein WBG70_11485 [Spirulinaceae cyanobacterium]